MTKTYTGASNTVSITSTPTRSLRSCNIQRVTAAATKKCITVTSPMKYCRYKKFILSWSSFLRRSTPSCTWARAGVYCCWSSLNGTRSFSRKSTTTTSRSTRKPSDFTICCNSHKMWIRMRWGFVMYVSTSLCPSSATSAVTVTVLIAGWTTSKAAYPPATLSCAVCGRIAELRFSLKPFRIYSSTVGRRASSGWRSTRRSCANYS